jgi:Protein of unknown function (DUF1353)
MNQVVHLTRLAALLLSLGLHRARAVTCRSRDNAVLDIGEFGVFEGEFEARFLSDGRKVKLLSPLYFTDPYCRTWKARTGSIVDGASIPQFFWSFIGGPFEGQYRNASVIHDVACDERSRPWMDVHKAFFYAMMASGTEAWRAKYMYLAVYHFGPRWSNHGREFRPKREPTNQEQEDLKSILDFIRQNGDRVPHNRPVTPREELELELRGLEELRLGFSNPDR